MEVHAPSHPLHTWRDFFIHIATIVVGLLIAIGLEQTVEALHHRHLRHATTERLREEITANQDQLKEDLHALDSDRRELEANMTALRQLRQHQPVAANALKFGWYWSSMADSGLQTARETAALSLLPAEKVEALSYTYAQQTHVNAAGIQLSESITAASIPLTIEPDLTRLTPAQIDELLRSCALSLNQLVYMKALTDGLQQNYVRALAAL